MLDLAVEYIKDLQKEVQVDYKKLLHEYELNPLKI